MCMMLFRIGWYIQSSWVFLHIKDWLFLVRKYLSLVADYYIDDVSVDEF